MIGYILAAGFGTRLKPLTEHVPKALVDVCGISLLERNLLYLHNMGMHPLAANAHYLPERIYSFQQRSALPFQIFHENGFIRGTGGALYFARQFLSSEESFCIMNVDILTDADLKACAQRFAASDCICALVAVPTVQKGTIRYSADTMEYAGVASETGTSSTMQGADFIGIAFYRREILDMLSVDDFSIIPVWKRVQRQGRSVKVFLTQPSFWRDIGKPSALADIHFDVLDQRVALPVPERLIIDYKRKNAFPAGVSPEITGTLGGYAWLDSTDVDPSARIVRSVIGADSHIAAHSTISNMIISPWGGITIDYPG